MDGFPVTIRLLDPPLHEFLPDTEELAIEIVEMKHRNADPRGYSGKRKFTDES